jgi:hypothetical protein
MTFRHLRCLSTVGKKSQHVREPMMNTQDPMTRNCVDVEETDGR